MLTRCPHCATTFRVTPEQLKPRQGQVRCGTCHEVFNALDSLADEAPIVIVPTVPDDTPAVEKAPEPLDIPEATATPVPPEDITEPVEPEPWPEAEPEPIPEFEPEPEPEPDPVPAPVIPSPLPEAAVAKETAVPAASDDDAETVEPEEWENAPASPARRRWPWIVGLLVLLFLFAGQWLYLYRIELAVLAPEARPALAAACELFGCSVARPSRRDLIDIESSDLLTPAAGEHLLLFATLRNRAPFDQEYPHLELTLTDVRDAALVRKVLAPADYLPADHTPAAGFAARGDVAVKLTLEAPGVSAIGFRLGFFYP